MGEAGRAQSSPLSAKLMPAVENMMVLILAAGETIFSTWTGQQEGGAGQALCRVWGEGQGLLLEALQ